MLGKINELSTKVYVNAVMAKQKVVSAGKRFMEDDRGLSGVVVAVLLILIAVLATVMLWGSLKKFLEDMWKQVSGAKFEGGDTLGG